MDFLLTLHSHLRHLIFLMGGIATILALITFLRKGVFTSWMRIAIKSYVYLLTLQVVIGLIDLFKEVSLAYHKERIMLKDITDFMCEVLH